MNKTPRISCALLFIITLGATVQAAADPKAYCSDKTLKGSYIFSIQGYQGAEPYPYASAGMFVFDGAGGIVDAVTRSTNRTTTRGTGTYSVGESCQGSMSLSSGNDYDIYVSPHGESFTFVRTSGNDVVASRADRVSHKQILK
ncbi:MAG: hypothetical protein C3F12_14550 [Candidatus Methylomirabilota bacterium]|nr:hypothetical protein [Candidatus Methylomirabilis sp.]NJD68329.1 hypothetical protein [candidate division NC10 bacterium]PWB42416.1 MAG: hypothetical protein C3F12_14550 [candidate division NC10 bacterium]